MYADVIGAKAGYKYEATINGGNYIIELYEFDTENLDSHGSSTVSAVKAEGIIRCWIIRSTLCCPTTASI